MKILIEGEYYPVSLLKDIISSRFYSENNGEAVLTYVGYFYSFENREVVYVLPKVFIDENKKVLFTYDKLDLLNKNFEKEVQDKLHFAKFKYLLVLFYKSLLEYKNREFKTRLLSKDESVILNSNLGDNEYSYLDIVLNILNFYKKNKSILLFIEKKYKSQQHKKVSWQKTINKTIPIMDKNNNPIYLNHYNKKKIVNTEETLLSIYFSVLNYFKKEYRFNIKIDGIYTIYTGKSFEKLSKDAPKILKKIKYKYFSDTLIKVYKLMELYFNHNHHASIKNKDDEFLMINKYHIVFEDMVDKLFSDKLNTRELKKLKNQEDGKIVDHIFEYDSLLSENESIFYIGDSKYYKSGNSIERKSIYKQFTYAKNVIQFNIDLLNKNESINPNLKYRDNITEGYNITPNFFIQGKIFKNLNIDKSYIRLNGGISNNPEFSYHFKDRLFDRDSLFVHYYNINFLFVLKSYSIFNSIEIESFRLDCKQNFRHNLAYHISNNFKFFKKHFEDETLLKDFVDQNFKKYYGKMYSMKCNDNFILILAFPNSDIEETLDGFESYELE